MFDRATLSSFDDSELVEALIELQAVARSVKARWLQLLGEFDRRQLGRVDGALETSAWLVMQDGVSRACARADVDTARRLMSLPAVAAASGDGRLSDEQLAAVAQLADEDSDAKWAERAPAMSAHELRRLARRPVLMGDDHGAEEQRRRSLRWWSEASSGGLRLAGRLPAADGAVVAAALERLAEQAGPDDDGTWAPHEQRAADALVAVCSARLADDADFDRACVVVHLDQGGAELEDGTPLADAVAHRLACDATVQTVCHNDDGTVGVGRRTRTVPPWLNRLVTRRDRHCRFPGCTARRGVHAHHLVHWQHGGPTTLDNLALLCPRHHRLVHDHHWDVSGPPDQPGGLRFQAPGRPPLPTRTRPARRDLVADIVGTAEPGL